MQVVTERRPTEAEWQELSFAWKVCKHVKSNGIVIAKDDATIGIGAGQMSRVDSVRLAVEKARVTIEGAVLASDAYFPFSDAARARRSRQASPRSSSPAARCVTTLTVEAVDKAGGAMVFTGRRHFLH